MDNKELLENNHSDELEHINEHGHEHEHEHEHDHEHHHSHEHRHNHEHSHGHGHDHSHGHGHDHKHGGEEEDRTEILLRLGISLALFILVLLLDHVISPAFMGNRFINTLCYLVPYFIVGWDVIKEAFAGLFHGELLGEEFLMVLASAGAFATGENAEGCAVLLLYTVGEFCQDLAVDRSRRSIRDLMDLTPAFARLEEADGTLRQVDPGQLRIGDRIVVLAGERIPVDGTVLSGTSMIDTSSMTGEPVPRKASEGSAVISGCINGEGRLVIRADKEYKNSTAARVMELTEQAADRKSATENFITRFARIYTPAVVGLAVLLALIPPLVTGDPFLLWIRRACTFLVISCPCALVISVPLGFFGGIGAAGRNGILVKGSNYLEALSRVTVFVSDKTGTLTKGEFRIVKAILPDGKTVDLDPDRMDTAPEGVSEETYAQVLKLISAAALAERDSTHPIAKSILEAADAAGISGNVPSDMAGAPFAGAVSELNTSEDTQRTGSSENTQRTGTYITGRGMHAVTEDGTDLLAGSRKLMAEQGVDCPEVQESGTQVYVAADRCWLGTLIINDRIKSEAAEALQQMRQAGIKKAFLLTGDTAEAALPVQNALGLNGVRSQLLPQEKVEVLEDMLEAMDGQGRLLYAGDGINDAPVLARADIGAAMGSLGSDAAIEAADVVIMDDDLRRIPLAMNIARKTVSVCRQNIVFALAVKVLFLLLGALGYAGMWMAVFADVGVALLCILNSMRMTRYKNQ